MIKGKRTAPNTKQSMAMWTFSWKFDLWNVYPRVLEEHSSRNQGGGGQVSFFVNSPDLNNKKRTTVAKVYLCWDGIELCDESVLDPVHEDLRYEHRKKVRNQLPKMIYRQAKYNQQTKSRTIKSRSSFITGPVDWLKAVDTIGTCNYLK